MFGQVLYICLSADVTDKNTENTHTSFTMKNCCLNTGENKKTPTTLLAVVTGLTGYTLSCACERVQDMRQTHRLHLHSGHNQVIPHKHHFCPPFLHRYPQYNKNRKKEQSFNCCYLKSSMGFSYLKYTGGLNTQPTPLGLVCMHQPMVLRMCHSTKRIQASYACIITLEHCSGSWTLHFTALVILALQKCHSYSALVLNFSIVSFFQTWKETLL